MINRPKRSFSLGLPAPVWRRASCKTRSCGAICATEVSTHLSSPFAVSSLTAGSLIDFRGHVLASGDISSASTRYRQMVVMVMSLLRVHRSPFVFIGQAHVQGHFQHPYTLPSPLSEFMDSDSDTSSFGALDPFGSFAPFGAPIPRPRFDDRFG